MVKFKGFTSLEDLKHYVKKGRPAIYHSSMTSTVIPFTKRLLDVLPDSNIDLIDLTGLPKEMKLIGDDVLVGGPITWLELREFLRQHNRDLFCWPTEKLACVLAGVATGASGSRSFSFGTIRDQLIDLKYIDYRGEEIFLESKKPFGHNLTINLPRRKQFKNDLIPSFERETDLLCGTEGQLGIITQVTLRTKKWENTHFVMVEIPHWLDDESSHIEIVNRIQSWKGKVFSCELIDYQLLKIENQAKERHDLCFFEVPELYLEEFYEKFIEKLSFKSSYEMTPEQYRNFREKLPRALADLISKNLLLKQGTDAQVEIEKMKDLLSFYRSWGNLGMRFCLFGHLGDAHLHFNFLAKENQEQICEEEFNQFYALVEKLGGSPFAEHGIGLLKQKYLVNFLNEDHYLLFQEIKKRFDPHNIFFPYGYLSMKKGPTHQS